MLLKIEKAGKFRTFASAIEAVRKTACLRPATLLSLSSAGSSSICPNSEHILLDNPRVKGILVFLNIGGFLRGGGRPLMKYFTIATAVLHYWKIV
jgi:hypothetical protein